MWPFKKKTSADKIIDVMDDIISHVAAKWTFFRKTLPFKDGVGLDEQIAMFSVPMKEGLNNTFPVIKDSPDALFMLLIAKGIEQSGTHSKEQLEQALGAPLP